MEKWFSQNGLLSQHLEGYQPRPAQETLTHAIENAIEKKQTLIAEAGTGTGKTFAYLLPAFTNSPKTLISTATKTLQEQIFTRDLPFIKKALRSPKTVALLKGRNSYLCNQRYETYLSEMPLTPEEQRFRKAIEAFADKTLDGDLAMLQGVPEDSPLFSAITSTRDNCLGRDCPLYEECYLQQARQRAKEADIVVVNHHLLMADLALKQRGFADILPDVGLFIIDEAHHLPDIATQFLGKQFSHRQLHHFCQDLDEALIEDAPDALDTRQRHKALWEQSQKILTHFPSRLEQEQNRLDWETLLPQSALWQDVLELYQQMLALHQSLRLHTERSRTLAHLSERLIEILITLYGFLPPELAQPTDFEIPETDDDEATTKRFESASLLREDWALWFEVSKQNYAFCAAPIRVAHSLSPWINREESVWCFLSATLAVNHSFQHYAHTLGIHDYQSLQLDSPFNYKHQALLYHPEHLPDPKAKDYTEALMQAVLPVLELTQGRALLLFTSYRALNEAAEILKSSPFTLLIQGSQSKSKLLETFKKTPKALLLATASFWEGVDIRGEALVCVVIDKLPFTTPNDPLTQARHQELEKQGLSPFIHDTLPKAIISLKQGVGRLIRDQHDYGVLILGDPRLLQKSYGQTFLNSLPPMVRTQKFELVQRFFNYHQSPKS
ncbi:MAG: ATP-dependent DNA helicase [Cardiobacteriaceae bacterium]|nr:ATP-dependent DNA helicase [Cardiobacteriaceae bacterium]